MNFIPSSVTPVEITTERLRILALTPPQMDLLLHGMSELEAALGLTPSGQELDTHTREAMSYLADLAKAAPNAYPWITNWQIILRETNTAVGSACFMNVPSAAAEVEIGYGIFPPFQGRGLMSEALDAFADWTLRQPDVSVLSAETDPDNAASRHVLLHCGFIPCGKNRLIRTNGGANAVYQTVESAMNASASPADAVQLMRFFKTGEGQYGEGDQFLGIRNPQTRRMSKAFRRLPLTEAAQLAKSPWHENRLCALLILVDQYHRGNESQRLAIFHFYADLARHGYINNWDLVDLSAPNIVGEYALKNGGAALLEPFAASGRLWEQRIAILSTLTFVRAGNLESAFRMVSRFLSSPHDLIHKACGWMLREAGKRDRAALTSFLAAHKNKMPRTALRYAIEHYSEAERQNFMARG